MHVVPESAEVSLCGLQNISHTAYNVYSDARVTDVPKYIIIHIILWLFSGILLFSMESARV